MLYIAILCGFFLDVSIIAVNVKCRYYVRKMYVELVSALLLILVSGGLLAVLIYMITNNFKISPIDIIAFPAGFACCVFIFFLANHICKLTKDFFMKNTKIINIDGMKIEKGHRRSPSPILTIYTSEKSRSKM